MKLSYISVVAGLFMALLPVCCFSQTTAYHESAFMEQGVNDVRYRDIKGYYNHREYSAWVGDCYIPSVAGVASFFLPGLGQCYCDEWGRGLGIFGANVAFALLGGAETSLMFYEAVKGSDNYRKYGTPDADSNLIMGASAAALLVTVAGAATLNIWNIFDAVRVAKVKNMYYQDVRRHPVIVLAPAVGTDYGMNPTLGLGLKLTF